MDVERLAMVGLFVQQQNENLLRLQQVADRRKRKRRRGDRVVWDSPWIVRRPEHRLYDNITVVLRNEE